MSNKLNKTQKFAALRIRAELISAGTPNIMPTSEAYRIAEFRGVPAEKNPYTGNGYVTVTLVAVFLASGRNRRFVESFS
jgi:hypothetical protein